MPSRTLGLFEIELRVRSSAQPRLLAFRSHTVGASAAHTACVHGYACAHDCGLLGMPSVHKLAPEQVHVLELTVRYTYCKCMIVSVRSPFAPGQVPDLSTSRANGSQPAPLASELAARLIETLGVTLAASGASLEEADVSLVQQSSVTIRYNASSLSLSEAALLNATAQVQPAQPTRPTSAPTNACA